MNAEELDRALEALPKQMAPSRTAVATTTVQPGVLANGDQYISARPELVQPDAVQLADVHSDRGPSVLARELAGGFRIVTAAREPQDAALERRRQRVRDILAARREIEQRPGNPKLWARLRKTDTRCAVLLGPTGAGKTNAARWAQLRHSGLWTSARALGACERKHPLGEGDPPLMRAAIAAPVLYIDDLGAEDPRDVGVIQAIVDARYGASLATFVTTALTRENLHAHFGAPYMRRLAEQHVKRSDGSEWPVLFVDCHEVKP